MRSFVRGWGVSATAVALVTLVGWEYRAAATEEAGAKKASQAAKAAESDGAELYNREWLPKDARAGRGDGLGPVFNDTSCVACHNQGGVGGGGPASKNVDVISVFSNHRDPQHCPKRCSAPCSAVSAVALRQTCGQKCTPPKLQR